MHVISGPWWSWLLRGIAAIVFGVLAMLWPGITFLAFVAMFAAYALIDGVLHLTAAFGRLRVSRDGCWLCKGSGNRSRGTHLCVARHHGVGPAIPDRSMGDGGGAMRIALAIQLRKVIAGEWLLDSAA